MAGREHRWCRAGGGPAAGGPVRPGGAPLPGGGSRGGGPGRGRRPGRGRGRRGGGGQPHRGPGPGRPDPGRSGGTDRWIRRCPGLRPGGQRHPGGHGRPEGGRRGSGPGGPVAARPVPAPCRTGGGGPDLPPGRDGLDGGGPRPRGRRCPTGSGCWSIRRHCSWPPGPVPNPRWKPCGGRWTNARRPGPGPRGTADDRSPRVRGDGPGGPSNLSGQSPLVNYAPATVAARTRTRTVSARFDMVLVGCSVLLGRDRGGHDLLGHQGKAGPGRRGPPVLPEAPGHLPGHRGGW